MNAPARCDDPRGWSPERLIHRQTYIDLIRSYLVDYGSQRNLARALGLSEPYVSYLLEHARRAGTGQHEHWSVLLTAAGYEVAEAFKYVKTPSEARAQQIAGLLGCDRDRREALLAEVRLARRPLNPSQFARPMSASQANAALRVIGDTHQAALYSTAETETASSYARVWDLARDLPASIDPGRDPAEFAQALMFLHDTAQALGRPDLALGFARQAIGALSLPAGSAREPAQVTRLRMNALLAETVSLNTLGLHRSALLSAAHAQTLPGLLEEPGTWLRSFLEQRLTAMSRQPRASLYEAEAGADQALGLVCDDHVLQAGITRRLLDVYLTRLTGRASRRADQLAADLRHVGRTDAIMSPMRRAQILRTLARYHQQRTADHAATEQLVGDCLRITTEANLVHQRAELVREFA
jgi:hypothetical protein